MSTNLDGNEEFRTIYATLHSGGRRGMCVQVTLVDRSECPVAFGVEFGRVAYASIPVEEFRSWLREVGKNLDAAYAPATPSSCSACEDGVANGHVHSCEAGENGGWGKGSEE